MFQIQHFAARPALWWFGQRDFLDMDPTYQRRGKVWDLYGQQLLIDSIINDYDIPKIYVADFTTIPDRLDNDKKRYAVIDGKQRFEALFKFFRGEMGLQRDFIYFESRELKLSGLSYKDLKLNHPDIASKVENYPLNVVHVVTDEINRVNDLFIRLNRSKPLTGAELRNAMVGPMPKTIRLVGEHGFFDRCIRFSANRGEVLDAAAKFLLFEERGGPADSKKANLDRFVRDHLESSLETTALLRKKVERNLDRMDQVFIDKDPLLSSQGSLPLFYWFVREVPVARRHEIRPFLLSFVEAVRENSKSIKKAQESRTYRIDSVLSDFALLSRSGNDQGSMTRRLQILNLRFSAWSS